jgi:hypothetical protein
MPWIPEDYNSKITLLALIEKSNELAMMGKMVFASY